MTRYDDYDDEPELPRRRQPPTPRRDSLMERRLRRARGEDTDDDLTGDYDEPPRYPRARPYEPAYGGGCASVMLYLVLGGAVVAALALLFSRQLVGGFTAAVPERIRQVVATPTPTIRDRGGTILQIRNLNRLETQSFSVERVIDARVERGNMLDTFLGDRLLLIASGTVVAGVDLSTLQESDVTISEDGERITLRLPPSQIFVKALDNQRTRVYDRQTGILAGENKDLETQARQEAEDEILKAACEGGIMQKAADEAQRSMEQFLRLLDFESVTVEASAGPCVAPDTVPTLPTTAPGS